MPVNDSKPADPYLQREAWKEIVVPVERAGRLDHIPARKPVTKKDYDTARKQNSAITRKPFGLSEQARDNYDRIFRSK